jgi:hypothetical protein
MFRAVPLPIIKSLFTVQSALVCVIQVWRQLSSRTRSSSKAVFKPVWHIPVPSLQWINSWWWAEELPETCTVSCRSKFGKLVHLVGFIIKKSVAMHGHMTVQSQNYSNWCSEIPFAVHKSPDITESESGGKLSALSMRCFEETCRWIQSIVW